MTSETATIVSAHEEPLDSSRPCPFLIPIALALLAAALMLFGGYQLGSGNQAIQIPFLKHVIDSTQFANDFMVQSTFNDYPSYFFKFLAFFVNKFGLEKTYIALHFLTTFAFIYALHLLANTLFKDWLASLLIVLFGIMGHHMALAGDPIYFTYFTHTWFVFPIAIFTITLFLRGRVFAAFALAGLVFNLHALTAAYLIAMMLAASIRELKNTGWKTPVFALVLFVLLASPTLVQMIRQKQVYDSIWLNVMHIRSSDHSFPSAWWDFGNSDIPRFLLLIAVGALSMAFPAKFGRQRKVFWMAFAILLLFALGWVFSESALSRWLDLHIDPSSRGTGLKAKLISLGISIKNNVLRAQLFRSSRLLMVLIFAQSAGACAGMIRQVAKTGMGTGNWFADFFSGVHRWFDLLLGVAFAGALAFPPLLHLLPWITLLLTLQALFAGRLAWPIAILSVFALTVSFQAIQLISFHVPLLFGEPLPSLVAGFKSIPPALFALGIGAGLILIYPMQLRWWANTVVIVVGLIVFGLIVHNVNKQHPDYLDASKSQDPWIALQFWAKNPNNTPKDAVFLVPPSQGGFRIFSDRAVAGEWRDGTQAYFNANYAGQWWQRMNKLMPDLKLSSTGLRVIDRGLGLESLQGQALANIAKQYGATYLVIPYNNRPPRMKVVYENPAWRVVLPETFKPIPPGVIDEQAWFDAEDFINEVCLPNIEKYRKGDVKISIVDAAGNPVKNVQYEATQTRQAFLFGATLPFFKNNVYGNGTINDEQQDPIRPEELAMFPDLFNFSMIGFSGKWMYTEPNEGVKKYDDLDAYVNWCVKNNIQMEYHYLGGIPPRWTTNKSDAEFDRLLKAHVQEIVDRYHDRVKIYQITNDDRYASNLLPLVKTIRDKYPDLKLGLSNCTQLTDNREPAGLPMVRNYASRNAKLDYFAPHAHIPRGAWSDPYVIYDILDKIAALDVKIHASEVVFPQSNIIGDLRSGRWTPQLQAEYAEWFYTIFFSHPACDAINYWNFTNDSSQPGAGLLTANAKPTPMYTKLKELIRGKWMTRITKAPLNNGNLSFRGFHGDYELKITLPDGKTASAKFSIEENKENVYRFVLDQDQLK